MTGASQLARATPLLAVDAVVLDTETTGLDPKEARIVQIGAIGLRGGLRQEAERFETLVDPGVPVPPGATAIHGIGQADLAGAPRFAEIAGKLQAFIGQRVVIGHNIGFDIAVLKREHERAGLVWTPPHVLDTRILGQLAAPRLAAHSLETLAAWLDVEVSGRHTAMGDARVTADIFVRLVPHLRERNIRTLAEAEAACAGLTDVFDAQYRAGWELPVRREGEAISEQALARIDAYPYRHRIRDVMSSPPIRVPGSMPLREALAVLVERKVSSIFVGEPDATDVAEHGILTERDILRALAAHGAAALDRPVADFATPRLESVFDDAYLYRAIGRMARLRIRHLAVSDETGRLVGALSQRDLLRLRADDAVALGDEIDSAGTVNELAAAWARLPVVARGLVAEGVDGRDVAGVISRELCALTRRAAVIAEIRMEEAGRGAPPVDYALLVLGSGGRGESLLAADQDNAIVYADPAPADAAAVDDWFATFGGHVADILHASGVPYCKGGVMARNAEWRASASDWRRRIAGWVRRSRPQDLLNVDIFFDLRPVYGNARMARDLWTYAYDQGRQSADFAKLLAEAAGTFHPPLTFFGGLRTENGRIDLKKGGLFTIVANARLLSIRHHVLERSTKARLQGLAALGIGSAPDLERLIGTHALLLQLMLDQQIADVDAGEPPSNRVDPGRLSRARVEELKRALSSLGTIDHMVRDLMFA